MHSYSKIKCAGFLAPLIGLTLFVNTVAVASSGDTHYVQINTATVYEAPSGKAQTVMRLNRGHKLKEFRSKGSWVKVLIYGTRGKDGWIQKIHVGPRDPNSKDLVPAESKPKASDVADRKSKKRTAKPSKPYLISISGSGFSYPFKANCKVIQGKNTVRYKFSGPVHLLPKSYSINGEAISCIVRFKDGRLNVKLNTRQQTIVGCEATEPGSVRIRSKGPWGKARGSVLLANVHFGPYGKSLRPAGSKCVMRYVHLRPALLGLKQQDADIKANKTRKPKTTTRNSQRRRSAHRRTNPTVRTLNRLRSSQKSRLRSLRLRRTRPPPRLTIPMR